jgi:hypothetical protein
VIISFIMIFKVPNLRMYEDAIARDEKAWTKKRFKPRTVGGGI